MNRPQHLKIQKPYRLRISRLESAIKAYYKERLISLVLFGSYARGRATENSDIDILIVASKLPQRRMKRTQEFIEKVENKIQDISAYISPILKTPQEVEAGSALFLDMIFDSYILFDKDNFFKNKLEKLRQKLETLGSKRVFKGNRWYWILKPDKKPGEIIEL